MDYFDYGSGDTTHDKSGKMTPAQKERLFDWYQQEATAWLEELMEADPSLRFMQEAINRAELSGLDTFEIFLAGEVADQYSEGTTEQAWLEITPAANKMVRAALRRENFPQVGEVAEARVAQAVANLKANGLWPW